jgi:hypothetical protein
MPVQAHQPLSTSTGPLKAPPHCVNSLSMP